LRLGEIKSLERFCQRVLDERLQTIAAFLNPTEYDDALSYRIAEAWLRGRRYDPARAPSARRANA
jgi:hypothetical protein